MSREYELNELITAGNNLVAALDNIRHSIISHGSGPVAPCFDAEDWEVERNRGSWAVVPQEALDRAEKAAEEYRKVREML